MSQYLQDSNCACSSARQQSQKLIMQRSAGLIDNKFKAIVDRNATLMKRIPILGSLLKLPQAYISSDPSSSLTKSRTILEKLLFGIYQQTMNKAPPRPALVEMLADKAFVAKLPKRIFIRMNSVREMSTPGMHDEFDAVSDAIRVMRDLIDVLEWSMARHNRANQVSIDDIAKQSIEILPRLRFKYRQFLQPEITSVRFTQSLDCCNLEITMDRSLNDYLMNKSGKRTMDLAFVSGGFVDDRGLFSPANPIIENAICFVADFDVMSIVNCTDLFTLEATKMIDKYWRHHGKLLEAD